MTAPLPTGDRTQDMKTPHRQTILLTGGTGFLGSNVLKRLADETFNIILLTRSSSNTARIDDLLGKVTLYQRDKEPLDNLFQDNRIDIILHCAADYGKNKSDPSGLVEANLLLPLQLLALAKKHKVSCFVNTDTVLDKEVNSYALSKGQFRDWLKVYAQDMTCANIALELFYGPDDNAGKFVTFVVRSILDNVEQIDLTKGEQKRDFIYIDDAVDAFLTVIRRSGTFGKGFFHFEVGTGRNIAVRDCVALVKKLAGNARTRLNFGAIPYREHELMESHADISAMQKLGWTPRVSLEEGLQRTIDFERRHAKSAQ